MTRRMTPILLGADAPRVLTVPMIAAALADRRRLPSRGTLFRWIREQARSGALTPVTRGLYLNQLAQPAPVLAEAAAQVRNGAIVSLQTVLGEAGITNNYPDMVTAVLPIRKGIAQSSRPVLAHTTEFRFHVMPARLLDERAGSSTDRLDASASYPRATPEKALLDWIYLGASPRTRLAGPPFDIDIDLLDLRRITRLAKHMKLETNLSSYLASKRRYDQAPDVRGNAAID